MLLPIWSSKVIKIVRYIFVCVGGGGEEDKIPK